jgi:hypothetical protein
MAAARAKVIPPSRPVLWTLQAPETAETTFEQLADGRRRIVIRHAELKGVSPEMLAWWYPTAVGAHSVYWITYLNDELRR